MTDINQNIQHQALLQINNINPMAHHLQDDLSSVNLSDDPFEQLDLEMSDEVQNKKEEPIAQKMHEIDQEVEYQETIRKIDVVQAEDEAKDQQKLVTPTKNKLSKKQRKKKKKEQKLRHKKLKKLRKQGKQHKESNHKKHKGSSKKLKKLEDDDGDASFSQNESEDSLSSCSSSDSMLANLNPRKNNRLNKLSSTKKERTQKKEGFSLKQLGVDAQVQLNQDNDEDDSFASKKKKGKKEKRKEKKQNVSNQDLLKKLLEIGLCDKEEQNKDGQSEGHYEYDDGIDALNDMKAKQKKKGPKINNKLFSDMNLDDNEFDNCQPAPADIQLDVKPRQLKGLSSKSSSFLSKTDQLKKIRSLESNIAKDNEYEKMISDKAKESIIKLMKEKQLEEVEQIELDVKVPTIAKGRSSGQINNSMYFRRFSQNMERIQSQKQGSPSPMKKILEDDKPSKLSRKQLFSNLMMDMKNRRSRNITYELIAKSFKVTQLDEIEEMRKKNEEKRRRDALRGSDCSEEDDEDYEVEKNKPQQALAKIKNENIDEKISEQNVQKNEAENLTPEKNNQNILRQGQIQNEQIQNNEIEQQEQFTPKKISIQVEKCQQPNLIDDEEYEKLIRMEEGEEDPEQDEIGRELEMEIEENQGQQNNQEGVEEEQDEQNSDNSDNEDGFDDIQESSENVQLEVEVSVSHEIQNQQKIQEFAENNEGMKKKKNNFLIESDEEEEQNSRKILKHSQIINEKDMKNLEEKEVYIELRKEPIDEKENIISEQLFNHKKIADQSKEQDLKLIDSMADHEQMRKQFRKLRKIATIIKNKKNQERRMKLAGDMFEEQAEEGSDNEEHDNQVKVINDDDQNKEFEGIDLDADLQEFLDNAVDIDEENEEFAFRKYLEDMKIQDREQIKRIINGDFKRRTSEYDNIVQEMDQDEKNRQKRMEEFEQYIKKKELEEGREHYINDEGEGNQLEKNDEMEEEEEVDEMNEENLKRYLDDTLIDSKLTTKKIPIAKKELPQSYQRSKQVQKRNTMKTSREEIDSQQGHNILLQNKISAVKLKKTSSHLNELIMKNKQKIKPMNMSFKNIFVKRK